MNVSVVSLSSVVESPEATVVIDVLRAFSTAAYAFACGVERIILVQEVEQARALKRTFPEMLLLGEVDGSPIEGFDFDNSPAQFYNSGVEHRIAGRTLVQRTTAGTRGVVTCRGSSVLLASSFVCAGATAGYLKDRGEKKIRLVVTGVVSGADGDEDQALADYLSELLHDRSVDPGPFLARVSSSSWGQRFASPLYPDQPEGDMVLCQVLDRFSFALPIHEEDGLLVMSRFDI